MGFAVNSKSVFCFNQHCIALMAKWLDGTNCIPRFHNLVALALALLQRLHNHPRANDGYEKPF